MLSLLLSAIGLIAALIFPAPLIANSSELPPAFQEWQVWEVKTGRPVPFEEFATALGSLDVIYLGEEHHNRWHIEAALGILRALTAQGRRPTLAMEMFGWDGQPALDRYLTEKDWPQDQFLKDVRWETTWGGPFEDYEPLPAFARSQGLHVLALNPPKPLVRLVAKQGLAQALADPEMARWGMQDERFPEDPAYHKMIVTPLRQCHDGLSDDAYQRLYEASMFRDEGMAKTLVDFLRREQAERPSEAKPRKGPIVSYAGGGHVQYRLPVPNRVARRHQGVVAQATIYMTSFEPARTEEIQNLLQESVADYLWLTPLGAQGAPRRCH